MSRTSSQLTLFESSLSRVINVASVPQRSPFRYPGGKTWLIPYIREWLQCKSTRPARFIEPFAGGAIVSLTAAFERLAKHEILIISDADVRVPPDLLANIVEPLREPEPAAPSDTRHTTHGLMHIELTEMLRCPEEHRDEFAS